MTGPRVLIPVFFNAPLGGLQENVRSQALGLRDRGFEPMVVCRAGPFADSIEAAAVGVLRSEFDSPTSDATRVLDEFVPDLVHCHPFKSRVLGLRVAEIVGCPAICTIHGLYHADIARWIERVVQVVAVSEGVRDYLVDRVPAVRAKTVVIPNGVNTDRFAPHQETPAHTGIVILVAGRFDVDTPLLVELLIDTWTRQREDREYGVRWEIAGHGALFGELSASANRLNEDSGECVVNLHGWLDQDALAALHERVDLAVAPGRNALESMASGVPTITVGQKAYYGPNWRAGTDGMAWNWGHVHDRGFEPGDLYRDIKEALDLAPQQRREIGGASRQFVEAFHAQRHVDDLLAATYRMHLAGAHR